MRQSGWLGLGIVLVGGSALTMASCGGDETGDASGGGKGGGATASSSAGEGGAGASGSTGPASSSSSAGTGGAGGEGGAPNPCAGVPPPKGVVMCGTGSAGAGGGPPAACTITCTDGENHTYTSECKGWDCDCKYDGQTQCTCTKEMGVSCTDDIFFSCCP